MCRVQDLFRKEVINLCNGERLGFVCDAQVDVLTGCVVALIVPEKGHGFNLFGKGEEIIIPWCNVRRIGDDLILVEIDRCFRQKLKER